MFLDGAWRATDAYIVDSPLFGPAQSRTRREGRVFGYGVHVDGVPLWNGRDESFAQYNRVAAGFPVRRVWGVYDNVGAFYDQAVEPWNRLNGLLRAGFGVLAAGANDRADALRRAG